MKTETTVGKSEFHQLYEPESNVKQAAIWEAQEEASIIFRDNPVYTLISHDIRYFVLLKDPSRIVYCMLAQILGDLHDLHSPYEISVWLDGELGSTSLLTTHLLDTLLRDHDIVFDGCMTRYGMHVWRQKIYEAFYSGLHVGYVTEKAIVYYANLKAFYADYNVTWGHHLANAAKIVIRR